jgi:hypothetical protein
VTEYPSGYRESTHEAVAAAHTVEGRLQGDGTRPRDEHGNPIPYEKLTYVDAEGIKIEYKDVTYDHIVPVVQMWNNGAVVGDTTYPPGHNTSREVRNDFYNDPKNIVPMSRSENSSKGGGGQRYADNKPGPNYKKR